MIVATHVKRYALALVLLLAGSPFATAQTVGDCERGTAEADLDINAVQARIFNNGNLFYGNTTVDGTGYLVPKQTGHSAIFAAGLWVGGLADGELRLAAATYDRFEFWPGPLDADGNPPDDCSDYDRIYVVSRGDVVRYHETGETTDDLRDWPVDLGAPVLDGDGVPGNYNLEGGDEPAISGDQTAWWVMNDAGNEHNRSLTPPMGLNVQAEAFAVASLANGLRPTTLYRYRLTNRSEQPLDSAYVALFVDVDLGDPGDDFVGSDTTLDMGFVYNGEEADDEYGVPPALGVQVLRGPVGLPNERGDDEDGTADEEDERLGMSVFLRIPPPDPLPDPPCQFTPRAARDYMQGRLCGGDIATEGGNGTTGEGPVTTFFFAGDPVAGQFWSEENTDGEGTRSEPGGRRFVVSTGPFRLEVGETEEIVFAIPFAQGTDRLDSVAELRTAARYVRNAYDMGFFEPERVRPLAAEPEPPTTFALRAFPNPFASSASVELTVADGAGPLRLAVYDVLGREMVVLADDVLAPDEYSFTLDGAELPAGVYFVRLETGRQTESIPLVHVE